MEQTLQTVVTIHPHIFWDNKLGSWYKCSQQGIVETSAWTTILPCSCSKVRHLALNGWHNLITGLHLVSADKARKPTCNNLLECETRVKHGFIWLDALEYVANISIWLCMCVNSLYLRIHMSAYSEMKCRSKHHHEEENCKDWLLSSCIEFLENHWLASWAIF